MARARRARASFVVTVAVAAAGSACGGGVANDGAGGSGGVGGGTVNPPACPAQRPTQGTPCPSPGLACGYEGSMDDCGQVTEYDAVCSKSGTWTVSIDSPPFSCNPPPPPQEVCDTYEPTAGTWCDTVTDLVCSYPAECCANVYQCVDNQWQSMSPPCNPPVPICPETEPAPGSPCDAPCGISYDCSYGACGDGGAGMSMATCSGGAWSVVSVDCG